MTLILGIAALFQTAFLPGYLLVRYFVNSEGLIRSSVLIFCISLLVNHLTVCMLTALHLYSRVSLGIILIIEIALLLKLKPGLHGGVFAENSSGDLVRFKTGWRDMGAGSIWLSALRRMVFFTAMATLAYFAYRCVHGFGTIFDQWDDVVSWNRWAVDWYNGRFPTLTWHYPQLLPSVWSITYQTIGTSELQFFAKGLMGIFPLMLLLVMLDLWLRSGAVGYLAGIPITAFLLFFANGVKGVGSGYADIPVAFMSFVPVYLLLTTASETGRRKGVLFAGSLITAGAALTKQAGLFILVLYPFVSWYLHRGPERQSRGFNARPVIYLLIAFALVLPWYGHTENSIRKGNESSEIKMVTADIHQGRGFLDRIADVPRKVEYLVKHSPNLEQVTTILGGSLIDGVKVTYLILLTIFALAILSLREPLWRVPGLLVMLPFTIVWLLLYSYDFRNLSLALPYIGAGAGLSLMHYSEIIAGRLPVVRLSAGMIASVVAVLLAWGGCVLDRNYLAARQNRLLRDIGNSEVNRFIYKLVAANEHGKIITNYQPVQYLPELDKKYLFDGFDNPDQISAQIMSGEARYLLIFLTEIRPTDTVTSLLRSFERAGCLESMQSPSRGYKVFQVKKCVKRKE